MSHSTPDHDPHAQGPRVIADRAVEIAAARSASYGPVERGHKALGMVWGALFCEHFGIQPRPLPAHVVCLLLVALKASRAVRPKQFQIDDYLDMHNYNGFAAALASDDQEFDDDCRQPAEEDFCHTIQCSAIFETTDSTVYNCQRAAGHTEEHVCGTRHWENNDAQN